jgi:hypothetical protein
MQRGGLDLIRQLPGAGWCKRHGAHIVGWCDVVRLSVLGQKSQVPQMHVRIADEHTEGPECLNLEERLHRDAPLMDE